MSQELTRHNGSHLPATLPKLEMDVCNAIHTFNQLRSFKLDAIDILEWKDTIIRVRPDVDAEFLSFAIDGLITGSIPYDERIGIRNIFIALDRVVMQGGKLKYLKPIY
jgi:hypothetical protein